jgi:signal transduction histidine kinase
MGSVAHAEQIPDFASAFSWAFAPPIRKSKSRREDMASLATTMTLSGRTGGRTNLARTRSIAVFTASIAHEVIQPLSGIITHAGTCLRMLATDPPNVMAREAARQTIRDGNRASEVILRLRALFNNKRGATRIEGTK